MGRLLEMHEEALASTERANRVAEGAHHVEDDEALTQGGGPKPLNAAVLYLTSSSKSDIDDLKVAITSLVGPSSATDSGKLT